MSKESEFVDLLNREMERLQGYLKGKKEPQTATECEQLVRPFVYKIEELTAHNYIKDQRIAELEEQLKNAIVPKFKVGQEVFVIEGKNTRNSVIDEIYWTSCKNCFEYYTRLIYGVNDVQYETIDENEIFATKEEALAKLKELQGE